jgi:hypothetical protein
VTSTALVADTAPGKEYHRIPTIFVDEQITVTTDSPVYTVPANSAVAIKAGSIANVSGAAVTVGVSLVPAGGAAGDGHHKVIPDTYSLAAGDELPLVDWLAGHVLGAGDSIAIHAGTANALDVVISGYLIS